MKKSPVAGISGSIRAACLTKANLSKAERHGKRLDKTSQARAVSLDPPVTSTGLDLNRLYRQHVKDAFVPKCKTIAKHIIVQFPKDLVDGEDAQLMLKHARAAVETIFGDQSIFADRVDRDEKGRHIVDIFVAPKYTKKTKHTSREAVSVTVHEVALAKKYGRKKHPWGRGQAMQDAIYEYFRDVMQLPGVQRGEPKANPGPDWKSAEGLRQQELAEMKAQAEADQRRAMEMLEAAEKREAEAKEQADAVVRKALEDADAIRKAARAEVEKQEAERRQEQLAAERDIDRDRERAKEELRKAREDAKVIRHDAITESKEQEERNEKARLAAELQQAELWMSAAKANEDAVLLREELAAARKQIETDEVSARETRVQAAEALAAAAAELEIADNARLEAERLKRDAEDARRCKQEQYRIDHAQMALLERATDEEQGLGLRVNGDLIEMNKEAMSQEEEKAYSSPWSKALLNMARKLAAVLERFREATRKLRLREEQAEQKEAKALRREREAKRLAEFELADQRKALEAEMFQTKLEQASARNERADLQARKKTEKQIAETTRRWISITGMLASSPEMFDFSPAGALSLSHTGRKEAKPELIAFLKKEPPEWVKSFARQQHQMNLNLAQAAEKEAEARQRAGELSDLLQKAAPLLTPQQEAMAKAAKKAIRMQGIPPMEIGL